ncbi:fungal-specific transcription factor domain-containing protein [Microdochium trichocladiopsis]|uniref:Fungal-specific transcription factor domain-containing protein n=1 Tax=Microdochium trichocladiopsis TaxID=1682393 RepID=A0A9P8YAD9_9PEZI|nr:fungal-specific transcription factor domain-containing protein [Microdochium trichocladiopsis]KAH7034761.1 fungal-specific transcription factor domain-containing protein [Microdochium trichocladiopsis]
MSRSRTPETGFGDGLTGFGGGGPGGTPTQDPGHPNTTPFSSRRRSARRSHGPQGGRRKGTACVRCRIQKIRCDDEEPACTNCVKAGHACLRARGNPELDSYVQELEGKVRRLERQLEDAQLGQQNRQATAFEDGAHGRGHATSPGLLRAAHPQEGSTDLSSPASTQINPSEPLAHNVGLLSLANSREPKYLGPSSGVVFGRLVFAAAPATQGLSTSLTEHSRKQRGKTKKQASQDSSEPPSTADLFYFAETYFEVYQPLYPFLDQSAVFDTLEHIPATSQFMTDTISLPNNSVAAIDHVHALLVSALGARVLESRLRTGFGAEALYSHAVKQLEGVPIFETIRGVQVLLLLALASFSFENGYNAWFLASTIIASCLDLGLQRRSPGINSSRQQQGTASSTTLDDTARAARISDTTLKSGIFWSAYSLDRTLCVVLGRPLTLRDEALDADFPDGRRSHSDDSDTTTAAPGNSISSITPQIANDRTGAETTDGNQSPHGDRPAKRVLVEPEPYGAACFSFRYDQITSEIKLMLHRVSQSPRRFPWPTDFPRWQTEVQQSCDILLDKVQATFRGKTAHGHYRHRKALLHERTTQELELKHHACIMLLHRPSPAISQPSKASMAHCYASARATIGIYSAMHRFANLPNTWLVAHAVFVSGITMLYCLWTDRTLNMSTEKESVRRDCESCTKLLKALGETWSVAEDAMVKFERLASLTESNWDSVNRNRSTGAIPRIGGVQQAQYSGMAAGAGDAIPSEIENFTAFDQRTAGMGMSSSQDSTLNEPGMDFSDLFLGELGDMSTWFDLSWLHDTEDVPIFPSS